MLKGSSLFLSFFSLVFAGIISANGSRAADAQDAARESNAGASGRWIVNADLYGTALFYQMHLKEETGKLIGDFAGDKLEGTVTGNTIHFVAKDEQGGTEECTATVRGGTMSGTIVFTDAGEYRASAPGGCAATARIHADNVLPAVFGNEQTGFESLTGGHGAYHDRGCGRNG